MLEGLEQRRLPSTLTVLNTNDSGASSLRAEIAAAKSGDTIVFNTNRSLGTDFSKAQTITLTSGELLVSRNITINGPGADKVTISGGNNSRVFEVASTTKSVVLSGLTITGGLVQFGGGGGILNHGTLTVSTCVVSDNSVTAGGGGIFNDAGTLTVTSSTISGNKVPYNGGAINSSYGVLTVTASTLDDNYAGFEGGAIINIRGAMTVSACHLDDNTSGTGGGIFNIGNATVSGTTLSGNRAENSGEGGAIANYFATSRTGTVAGPLTVSNCILSGNSAGAGGGIWNFAPTGILKVIDGCSLSGNSAGSGGGIDMVAGALTISGATLSGNTATLGAGIDVEPSYYLATVTVSGCTLSGNVASDSGGGIYVTSSGSGSVSMTVSGCTLTGNVAGAAGGVTSSGGAIYVISGNVTISGCTLTGNSAPNAGGAIYLGGGTVTLTNDKVAGNTTTGYGGGLYIAAGANVSLDSFTVANIIDNTDGSGLNGPTANIDG
jgi:parallel beta-helix repeat protein